jgi:AAHS family 4-hydroxybenzoate transporter-like MFS transporter
MSLVDETPTTVDIGRLLDEGHWPVLGKLFIALTAIAVLLDGFDNQVLGFALPAMIKDWHVEKGQFGPVVAIGLVGMMIGAVAGGLIGDRIGRKKALTISVVLFALSTGAVAAIHSLPILAVLRLLAGIGIGSVFPSAGALAAEFSPRRSRSLAVAMTIVCVPLGGMVGGIIASYVLPAFGWRVLFMLGGASPLAIALLLLAALPESPQFLARFPERHGELRKLLARLGYPIGDGVRIISQSEAEPKVKPGLSALFTPLYLHDTLVLWGAFFFSLFAVYSVFNWAPTLLTSVGVDIATASRAVAAYNFGGVIGAVCCAWVIGRMGSRIPMLLMAGLGAVSAAVLAVISRQMPEHQQLMLWMGLHGLFVNAIQTTLYALSTHIYRTDVRATGSGVALSVGRTGSIIGSLAGGFMVGGGGPRYFILLALAMVGAGICIALVRRHVPPGVHKSVA